MPGEKAPPPPPKVVPSKRGGWNVVYDGSFTFYYQRQEADRLCNSFIRIHEKRYGVTKS